MQREAAPIEGASVESLAVPVVMSFAISKETLETARIALVTLRDAEGRVGLGECSPFPSLTGDTVETAAQTASEVARSFAGMAPLAALAALERMRGEVLARSRTAYVGIESALWDLHARQLGAPLARLFGPGAAVALETDITLPIMAPEQVPAFWERFAPYGFRLVKIKVSGRVDEDVALVRAMAACRPKGAAFTLDGNQGYTLDAAKRLVAELGRLGLVPEFFEQPLPADDWRGPRELRAATGVPVCLDETVASAAEALRVAHERTAEIINLKIMKAGIGETLRIAQVAKAAGLKLMIGGMLESEVAMGVSLALALGTGVVDYADLDTPFFFAEPVTAESPWHGKQALLRASQDPGHGLVRLGVRGQKA